MGAAITIGMGAGVSTAGAAGVTMLDKRPSCHRLQSSSQGHCAAVQASMPHLQR